MKMVEVKCPTWKIWSNFGPVLPNIQVHYHKKTSPALTPHSFMHATCKLRQCHWIWHPALPVDKLSACTNQGNYVWGVISKTFETTYMHKRDRRGKKPFNIRKTNLLIDKISVHRLMTTFKGNRTAMWYTNKNNWKVWIVCSKRTIRQFN